MRNSVVTVTAAIVLSLLVLAPAAAQSTTNLATDATYAYFDRVPGEAHYYHDDWLGEHPVHTQGLAVYGSGDLNDGVLQQGIQEVADVPSPDVAFWIEFGRIIFDLGVVATIDRIELGTHRFGDWGNYRPEAVGLSFSATGDADEDFTVSYEWDIPTVLQDGRATHTFTLDTPVAARYVQFDFRKDENIQETHLDEIWIFGSANTLTCTGFHPPMANYPVTVKGNRALPLKANLYDVDGYEMTDLDLAAPPVVQVWFQSAEGGDPVDVTDEALPAGQGDDGNQCFYDGDQWHFNLKTRDYTSPGTYTVTLESGDDTEYSIDPSCETQFVIK